MILKDWCHFPSYSWVLSLSRTNCLSNSLSLSLTVSFSQSFSSWVGLFQYLCVPKRLCVYICRFVHHYYMSVSPSLYVGLSFSLTGFLFACLSLFVCLFVSLSMILFLYVSMFFLFPLCLSLSFSVFIWLTLLHTHSYAHIRSLSFPL